MMAETPEDREPAYQPLDPSDEARELGEAAIPEHLHADFSPLSELEQGEKTRRKVRDSFLRDSLRAQEIFDRAVAAAAANDEDQAVTLFLRAAKLAEEAREWYIAAVAMHRVGDFLQNPRPPFDLEWAFRMYRRAIAAYEQCGMFAEARGLSYRLMYVKLRRAKLLGLSWWTRAELFLYWLLAGFGLRPMRVIRTAVVVVMLYGALYWSAGGVRRPNSETDAGFWDAVYFSGVTFATVGYGDLVPAPRVRILALTEGMIGVFTMSFFVVVVANRLRN
jgi:hypothetical protein